MTILPTTPSAVRTLITSNGTNVKRLDETLLVAGVWESPTLNRGGPTVHRFVKLILLYQADADSIVNIEFTRDGGRKWSSALQARMPRTAGGTRQKLIHVNLTGYDVRFRLSLPKRNAVSIFGYITEQAPSNELGTIGQ